MSFLKIIVYLYILSYAYSKILTKHSSLEISSNIVIFESKDFKDNEDMHFKIKSSFNNFGEIKNTDDHYWYDIEYVYCDSNGNAKGKYFYYINFKKTDTEDGYHIKYFTIKKKWDEYRPSNGNYIKIRFNLYDNWAIVTNTEKDEGKIATWVIVVIVVIVVAIIGGMIIFFVCRCIRRRKAMAATNAANAANASSIAAQNQAYVAQINQNAYMAEQNYQAQAYQAQIYSAQDYQNPINVPPQMPPDVGFTSKAAI